MSLNKIKTWLSHPLARKLDIDSPNTHLTHAQIIDQKPFLKKIYQEWYRTIIENLPATISGPVCELGSGGGFLKQILPGVITSEVHYIDTVDLIMDGQFLPFKNASLKGIVMVDVLHHIPNVSNFFSSAIQCLKPGGMIIMIEPWSTRWSKFIYTHFHHEPFNTEATSWRFPQGGPMSQANGVLPWIVFERDKKRFENRFKSLKVSYIVPMMPFCYLLSGGVSFRSFLPGVLYPFVRKFENAISPLRNNLSMFALIGLTRQ